MRDIFLNASKAWLHQKVVLRDANTSDTMDLTVLWRIILLFVLLIWFLINYTEKLYMGGSGPLEKSHPITPP